MSDWMPRKGWDRVFVLWLLGLAIMHALQHEWSAAGGWLSGATGWYFAYIERDLRDEKDALNTRGQS